jgi:hypothetical protein
MEGNGLQEKKTRGIAQFAIQVKLFNFKDLLHTKNPNSH